jgi:hypothetical protein
MPAKAMPGKRGSFAEQLDLCTTCWFYLEMKTDVNINNDIEVGQ